jgi:hypothetical protein
MKSDIRKRKLSEFLRKILRAIAYIHQKLRLAVRGGISAISVACIVAIASQCLTSVSLEPALSFGAKVGFIWSILNLVVAVEFYENTYFIRIACMQIAFAALLAVNAILFLPY